MKIEGKHIVLTGVSSGIGKELCDLLLKEGAHVYGTCLPGETFPFNHDKFYGHKVDFKEVNGVEGLFQFVLKHTKHIDAFIANAGYAVYEKRPLSKSETQAMMSVNVLSIIEAYQAMRKIQKDKAFNFMTTASVFSYWPLPGYPVYASTKAAIDAYMKVARYQADSNQKVQVLYPVATKTNFFNRSEQNHKSWMMQTPEYVAKRALKGLKSDKKSIHPSRLVRVVYKVFPFLLIPYVKREKALYKEAIKPNNKNT